MISQTISHYRIINKLGAGGMGEIYLAEDSKLRRKVALKVLSAEYTRSEERLHRLQQEAYAASGLNHPNILTIYEVGLDKGTHFIATEFIEGETVRQRLESARMTVHDALDVAIQAASALAAAHQAGIVHRDFKPENIMLRPDGYVKVLDFGLAKLTERQTPTADTQASTVARVDTDPGVVMGTANYMSPEQARGLVLDARTDIFSLGVVLYEMIAGRPPFKAATNSDLIVAILDREPPPLERYAPGVSAELQWVVSKALRKDRDERYQTTREMLGDLKNLKRELDVRTEIERSLSPELTGMTAVSAGGEAPSVTANALAVRTSGATAAASSSVEIIIREIKRHKMAALIASLIGIPLIAGGLIALGLYLRARNTAVAIESIAVLPFANQNRDPEAEYLSDGLTESIINNLTQLPELRVTARSSVFRYKGKEDDPFGAGQQLGVRAVVVGRLLQRGENLTISVELVDVLSNKQLWGEQYNRKMSDLVAVQQDISREIFEKLRTKLTGEERRQFGRGETANAEAFRCYLKGRYYWNRRTGGGLKKALEQFQQAVDKDPTYALAYVGVADCYAVLESYAGTPSRDTLPKARAAALGALQIDNSLAEAHTSLAYINSNSWQFGEAEKEFKRGMDLNPNYPTAHHWYTIHLLAMGRLDEATAQIKVAQQLDPLSPVISVNVATLDILKGDLSSAIEECKKIIELDPSFPSAHVYLGWAYLKQGREQEAIAELQKGVEVSGRGSQELGYLGHGYAAFGKRGEARAVLRELEEKYARQESIAMHLAAVYAGLGEKDEAFAWLERDFQARAGSLIFITYYPDFDTLRDDPRYTDLLRRMGLRP